MRRRLWRLLLQMVRPARLVEVRHPHGHVAVGGRTTLYVRVLGHGSVGAGDDVIEVDGAFDGLLSVPVVAGLAVVEACGLPWRQRRHVAVVDVAMPSVAPPLCPKLPTVSPPPTPVTALPSFDVSIEVP